MKERYYFLLKNDLIQLKISSDIKEDVFNFYHEVKYNWGLEPKLSELFENKISIQEYILLHGYITPMLTKNLINCIRDKINFSFILGVYRTEYLIDNKKITHHQTNEIVYNFKFKKFQQKRNNYRKEEPNG